MSPSINSGVSQVSSQRPSFDQIYMRLAQAMSERSTCARLQVGCVIASDDFRRVYAVGYNGGAAGAKNGCDVTGPEAVGLCGCIHAESNAIINCSADREKNKIVYCTDLPCLMCAKMLVNLGGVKTVYFGRTYRKLEGQALLQSLGIYVEQLKDVAQ